MDNRRDADLLNDILAEYDESSTAARSAERDQKFLEEELFGSDEDRQEKYDPQDIAENSEQEEAAPAEADTVQEAPVPSQPADDSETYSELKSVYDDMGLFRSDLTDSIIEDDDIKQYIPSDETENDGDEENDQTAEDEDYEDDYDEDYPGEDEYDEDEKDDDRPVRRRSSGASKLVFALILVTIVISVAIISSAAVISASSEILGLNKSGEPKTIDIPENTTTSEISRILAAEGIINDARLFSLFSNFKGTDGTYQPGEHKLIPNMTYGDIIEELQRKIVVVQRDTVMVTFEEGIRLDDAARLLQEHEVCNAKEFINAFNNTTFGFDFEKRYESNSLKYYKMEGYLFPDTYEFYKEEEPTEVAKKILRNFDNKLTPDYYGRMEDMDMSLDEVITLASIVQREAGTVSDMKTVASVFLNRLDDPDVFPKLQSNPTTNYSQDVVRAGLEVYSQSICDAYDTYKGEGLPPGAICNPGIDAIEAVLYPKDTKYYYFCSNVNTGKFYYAEDLVEHEENLEAAGIR